METAEAVRIVRAIVGRCKLLRMASVSSQERCWPGPPLLRAPWDEALEVVLAALEEAQAEIVNWRGGKWNATTTSTPASPGLSWWSRASRMRWRGPR
jgi:hypothetical protein